MELDPMLPSRIDVLRVDKAGETLIEMWLCRDRSAASRVESYIPALGTR